MMKHAATSCSVLFFLSFAALCGASDTPQNDHPYLSIMRSLSINRSLLNRAETEFQDLRKQETRDTTGSVSRRMSDLRYKIQALKEDAERLRGALPSKAKAEDFLGEVVHKKESPVPAPSPVNTVTEKRVDDKESQIYRMHEKALQAVEARKFAEAEKLYEEIVLLSPDDDEAYLLLGHTCLAAGHYEKAGDAFHNAVHIDPRNAREIPRLYENILLENPSDDEAMTQLGYAHLLLGSAENARTAFQDALAVNPSNIEAKKGLLEIP